MTRIEREIARLELELEAKNKQVNDFDQREQDAQVKDRKATGEIADMHRKIEKSRSEAESNEHDLEKKKEELRTVEQNIRTLESGGEVEDQATTIQKNLDAAKNDLKTLIAKQKGV